MTLKGIVTPFSCLSLSLSLDTRWVAVLGHAHPVGMCLTTGSNKADWSWPQTSQTVNPGTFLFMVNYLIISYTDYNNVCTHIGFGQNTPPSFSKKGQEDNTAFESNDILPTYVRLGLIPLPSYIPNFFLYSSQPFVSARYSVLILPRGQLLQQFFLFFLLHLRTQY